MGGFMMKRLFVLVSLVMAALFITACGGGEKADKKAANKPIVIYTAAGENNVYICIKTPPSGTLPTNTTYWRILTIKGVMGESGTGLTFRYNWESGTSYYTEDVATYDNIVWCCLKDNTDVVPGSDSSVWKIIYTPTQNVYPVQAQPPANINTGDTNTYLPVYL